MWYAHSGRHITRWNREVLFSRNGRTLRAKYLIKNQISVVCAHQTLRFTREVKTNGLLVKLNQRRDHPQVVFEGPVIGLSGDTLGHPPCQG